MQSIQKQKNSVTWSQFKVALGKAQCDGLRTRMHDGRVAVIRRLSDAKVKPVAALFSDRLDENLNEKWSEIRKARSCVVTAKNTKRNNTSSLHGLCAAF